MTQTSTFAADPAPAWATDVPAILTDVRTAERQVATIALMVEQGYFAAAFTREARLHMAALEGIAGSNAQAAGIAAAVLETRKIDFPRNRSL